MLLFVPELVSIPYRYKKNDKCIAYCNLCSLFQSPIGTKKNEAEAYYLPQEDIEFQSPIGTKKNAAEEQLLYFFLYSFNPLQVQTKLFFKGEFMEQKILFQSPIGTNKTLNMVYVSNALSMFQSPIGTNKTRKQ